MKFVKLRQQSQIETAKLSSSNKDSKVKLSSQNSDSFVKLRQSCRIKTVKTRQNYDSFVVSPTVCLDASGQAVVTLKRGLQPAFGRVNFQFLNL